MNVAQQIINGIVLGSGYACIALGWTILLGVARLVNFAHGQLYMLGAFVTWYAITKLGLPYPLAILVAIVVLGATGLLMQSAMMRLVMTQNLTSLMIVTLGLGYVLQGVSALIFGGNPQILPGTLARAKVDLGTLWFTWQDVLVLVVTILLYGAVLGIHAAYPLRRGHSRRRRGPQARGAVRDQRQDSLSARLHVRMFCGGAGRGAGCAPFTDLDQYGL
ncbi:branched-subunit amino acid ABC-type transport system permease component [Bradyrhizobium sp. F1.13.4]